MTEKDDEKLCVIKNQPVGGVTAPRHSALVAIATHRHYFIQDFFAPLKSLRDLIHLLICARLMAIKSVKPL